MKYTTKEIVEQYQKLDEHRSKCLSSIEQRRAKEWFDQWANKSWRQIDG